MQQTNWPLEILLFFIVIISIALIVDFYGHRRAIHISITNSITWSIFWMGLAMVFYGYLWISFNKDWANLYLVGYLLEKSLSIDNLMIFMAIFSAFGITGLLQRKILFWGIFGAIVFRGIFVFAGSALFQFSSWVELLFAIFIIWSAIKMLQHNKQLNVNNNTDFSTNWSIRYLGKILPIYPTLYGNNFFVTQNQLTTNNLINLVTRKSNFYITPAFLCLVTIEISDIAFAFDSVPAIIAITQEPILVYAAIIFAILGLRSLYLVLAVLAKYLVYLEKTVIVLLCFIAIKMLLQFWNHTISNTGYCITPGQSLIIVLSILATGVIVSLWVRK